LSCSTNSKSLLDIQNQNVIFDEDCIKEETYKGEKCKCVFGKLSNTPTRCEKCGVKNTNFTGYKMVKLKLIKFFQNLISFNLQIPT